MNLSSWEYGRYPKCHFLFQMLRSHVTHRSLLFHWMNTQMLLLETFEFRRTKRSFIHQWNQSCSLGCLGCTLCYDDDEKWHQHRIQSNTFVLCFWIICYWNFVKSDVIFDQFCDDCKFFVKSSHCPSFS